MLWLDFSKFLKFLHAAFLSFVKTTSLMFNNRNVLHWFMPDKQYALLNKQNLVYNSDGKFRINSFFYQSRITSCSYFLCPDEKIWIITRHSTSQCTLSSGPQGYGMPLRLNLTVRRNFQSCPGFMTRFSRKYFNISLVSFSLCVFWIWYYLNEI